MNKITTRAVLQAFITTISFFTCDAQQLKAKFNLQQVKDRIEKSQDDYFKAFAKGDSSLLIERYTDDCWIMPSNQPTLCGPEAALDFFRVFYYQLGVRKGKFISVDLFGDGQDFVTEVGFYQFFDAKNRTVGDGKYIVLWKKTATDWKRFRDSFSPNHDQDTKNDAQ
jgi:ketosteroid isomerase-like protein